MENSTIYIIIPTFKETLHVKDLLHDLFLQDHKNFIACVVNCNPGDNTSEWIASLADKRICEIQGTPNLFWTGAIELGQRYVHKHCNPNDHVLLINCDVRIPTDHLSCQIQAMQTHPRSMICPITVSGGHYISSGCRMASWFLGIGTHYLRGPVLDNQSSLDDYYPVDMLVGRAVFTSVNIFDDVGYVASSKLPHYAADYEYSARAKRKGYRLFVTTLYQLNNDSTNSGIKSDASNIKLLDRISGLASIRSPLNPLYRIRYVIMVYPFYAIPSGVLLNLLKIIIETFLGKHLWRALAKFR